MSSSAPDDAFDSIEVACCPDGATGDDNAEPGAISFCSIHSNPLEFKSPHRQVFVPNKKIYVKFLNYERNAATHILNPNLYEIELKHGDFTWVIKKRFKDFQKLHQRLKLFTLAVNLPLPTKAHRERRASFRNQLTSSSSDKSTKSTGLSILPEKAEVMVSKEDMSNRMEQLQDYLNNILSFKVYRNYHETVNFLEASHLSFVGDLGDKGKEGLILKRAGSTRPGQGTFNLCGLLDGSLCVRSKSLVADVSDKWLDRWLFVKDTFMGYIRPTDGSVNCVMLFDSGFEVSSGSYAIMHSGLQITNLSRQLLIKCQTNRKKKDWIMKLRDVANNQAKDFTQKNRYNSFAPNRESMQAAWFVDGCTYMAAVADALESAQEEIFIADWWLSPEIYLKRPTSGDTWQLDTILKRKASQGVKIFVLLYKEVEVALSINSQYSQHHLAQIHKNIKVLRHPNHVRSGVLFWAHHEKIVVVDQTYAFLGGIDLCYGRWDDHNHRLTDVKTFRNDLPPCPKQTSSHQTRKTSESNIAPSVYHLAATTNMISLGTMGGSTPCLPNDDFMNCCLKVESVSGSTHSLPTIEMPVENIEESTLSSALPSIPKTFVNPPPSVCGSQIPPVNEINGTHNRTHNLTSRLLSTGRKTGDRFHKIFQKGEHNSGDEEAEGTVNIALHIEEPVEENTIEASYINEYSTVADSKIENTDSPLHKKKPEERNLWIGKDYTNFIIKDFSELDLPYQDSIDRNTTPRMPWHDIGVMVQGAAARDVARHFIERWNAAKLEKSKFSSSYSYLLPKSYTNLDKVKPILLTPMKSVDCQVVRSIAQWSGGFLEPDAGEQGIHDAYEEIITNAKHYIYIENQFFITQTSTNEYVQNQIGDSLFKRIMRAHKERKVFRVYVVMPLLPGFEGEVGSCSGKAINAITYWNYSSICRGKDAIINRLKEAGISNPTEYISFYGLRTHSTLHGDLVSELIYVHSKLLIADDNIVICGSANINDRSLLGTRDSEIAVVLKDCEFDEGVINGNSFESGKFAGSLRRYLFKEHLGLLTSHSSNNAIDIQDPICDAFYHNTWRKTATLNTHIYEKVFNCLPCDQATNFETAKKIQRAVPLSSSDPVAAAKHLSHIKGHLVCLPLEFLKDEELFPNLTTVEGAMPSAVWT